MTFYDDLLQSGRNSPDQRVRVERGTDRAVVTLHDPEKLNGLSALTRRLGYQGAFAFYAAGEHVDGWRAHEIGLVHEVVAHGELLAVADEWCTKIAALPAHAIAMTKPLLRAAADASWDHALAMEEFAEPQCFTTEAFQRSVKNLLTER